MIILYFITGSIFTILLLSVGIVAGYLLGTKQLDQKIEEVKRKIEIKNTPRERSGPVKSITAQEIALEREKSFVDKLKGFVEPDRPLV